MDDYNISTLTESKNEWSTRLTNILAPCIVDGIKSIFDEAYNMCLENDEANKYLMTFQNLLNNIPKWSGEIVNKERERIILTSGCSYLADLLTCVHITQLKSLSASRVGIKQKKVNINIPDIDSFIHKVYINAARKLYVNVYLYEREVLPLQIQKNNREIELIIKECILNSIRENIPVENLLRVYLDETQETDVEVEEKKEQLVDQEELKKLTKLEKQRELEEIKKEVKEKIEKESKQSFSNSLKQANKDLNSSSKNTDTHYSDYREKKEEKEEVQEDQTENDDELEEDRPIKINFKKHNVSNDILGITNIDDNKILGLDEVNLDSDFDSEDEEEEIPLDIEVLQ